MGGGDDARFTAAEARRVLARGVNLHAKASHLAATHRNSTQDVQRAFADVRTEMLRRELESIPIARLKDTAAEGRLRLGVLERSGLHSVFDVYHASPAQLLRIPGVGEQTAHQAYAAARQVAKAVEEGLRVRVDLDPQNQRSTSLLTAVHRFDAIDRAVAPVKELVDRIDADLTPALEIAGPARSRIRMLFAARKRKDEIQAAVAQISHWAAYADRERLHEGFDHAQRAADLPALSSDDVWADFQKRSVEYYGALGQVVDLKLDVQAAEGFVPSEIAEQVNQQTLDDTFRRVSLRGYQAFGAKYALVQRRVIIGDEMGLGKTIQALAVICHLKSLGATHFLVVCPASVLINWVREIHDRSNLRAYRLHGVDRLRNLRTWLARGDVAVTTFDTLGSLEVPDDVGLGLLVIDEAHFIKNPAAQRSRNIARWTDRPGRVLFLSGTPMENRVEEFRQLVHYLQPAIAAGVQAKDGVAGADAFRRLVAPVYLRRNQADVLTELPDVIKVDEWEDFTAADRRAYRQAVLDGNFMAMRRAAFPIGESRASAKLDRLRELVQEAGDNDHKVVIFSFFRSVLESVVDALGPRCYGPLNGGVPPAKRQEIVDAFSAQPGHAVLLSQIQAGGVGLNIQAASVVILCEPQVKPTLEDQAVARVHRMGQVRTVQVHRLLTADSVDQRMLEILAGKTQLFNAYARRSDVADSTPEAVDVSEQELASRVVAEEQERLAREAMQEAERSPEIPESDDEQG